MMPKSDINPVHGWMREIRNMNSDLKFRARHVKSRGLSERGQHSAGAQATSLYKNNFHQKKVYIKTKGRGVLKLY